MGERGPAAQPPQLKEARGNPGKRPPPPRYPEPAIPVDPPECPDWLEGEARAEWAHIVPALHDLRLVSVIDTTALAAYCEAYARYREALRQFTADGLTTTTDKGNVVQHPAVGVANKSLELMHRFGREFGLTPSSRGRMTLPNVPKDTEESEWDDLLGVRN